MKTIIVLMASYLVVRLLIPAFQALFEFNVVICVVAIVFGIVTIIRIISFTRTR